MSNRVVIRNGKPGFVINGKFVPIQDTVKSFDEILSGELEFDTFSVISHKGYFSARPNYHSPREFRPFVYQGDNL